MAITTVTVTDLTLNTESADLNTAAFGTLGTLIVTGAAVCLENAQFLGQGLGWSIGNHEQNMAGTSAGNATYVLVLATPRDL